MNVYYSEDYVAATHDFDTTRKAGRIADALRTEPIAGVQLVSPRPVTRDELLLAHTPEYVDCVFQGGGHPRGGRRHRSSGFAWSRGLVKAVVASTGGVVEAVAAACNEGIAGSLSSGLHHAHADSGGGFCTFNGLAVATRLAIAEGLLDSVLILDLDAHFGDGTMAILGRESGVTIVDVSAGHRLGREANDSHHAVMTVEANGPYLEVVDKLLREFEPHGADLVLYNAGMDPHESCDIGGVLGVTTEVLRQREELVFSWCRRRGFPVAFVLAGGYEGEDLSRDELDGLHRMTIEAAVKAA